MKALKVFSKTIILAILVCCARMRLARMKRGGVKVIGVTGSVGKTTCKEAVAHVLRGVSGVECSRGRSANRVLSSKKSYNTEFGLPLTILELESEFSSVIGWVKNLLLAVWRGVFGFGRGWVRYDFLVLEMGVDKPGDMDVLFGILAEHASDVAAGEKTLAVLDCAIFTGVHTVHMADGQFASLDAIAEEKGKIMSGVKSARDGGVAFINGDDERGKMLAEKMICEMGEAAAKIVLYGSEESEINVAANEKKLSVGAVKSGWNRLEFEVTYGKVRGEFAVPILGEQHVGSLLPAIGCGLMMGMYIADIVERMKSFKLPPGRLSLIEAKNGTWILDSSYNASPDAVKAAVETLEKLPQQARDHGVEQEQKLRGDGVWDMRKIFIFGNMNELGSRSEEEHRSIGKFLAENGRRIDVLVTVGEYAAKAGEEFSGAGGETHVFMSSEEAADFFEGGVLKLRAGDLILVKGSQNNVRLEKFVKRLMKEPGKAAELLVRQDW